MKFLSLIFVISAFRLFDSVPLNAQSNNGSRSSISVAERIEAVAKSKKYRDRVLHSEQLGKVRTKQGIRTLISAFFMHKSAEARFRCMEALLEISLAESKWKAFILSCLDELENEKNRKHIKSRELLAKKVETVRLDHAESVLVGLGAKIVPQPEGTLQRLLVIDQTFNGDIADLYLIKGVENLSTVRLSTLLVNDSNIADILRDIYRDSGVSRPSVMQLYGTAVTEAHFLMLSDNRDKIGYFNFYYRMPALLGIEVSDVLKKGNDPAGAAVFKVLKGSAADLAGLKVGDILVAVDGNPCVALENTVVETIKTKKPGDKIAITLVRGGEKIDVVVAIGSWTDAKLLEQD
jgi:hypothetical protein